MAEPVRIAVSVAYALPDRQWEVELEVRLGTTAAEALQLAGPQLPLAATQLVTLPMGIYGQPVSGDQVLQLHDRVELYRPLLVDPKTARRQRAADSAGAASSAVTAASAGADGTSGVPDAGK